MANWLNREKASHAKRYLEEKQRDLEIIERNMIELNELMRDFAVMVESANEPLDQIDTYLKSTKVRSYLVDLLVSTDVRLLPTGQYGDGRGKSAPGQIQSSRNEEEEDPHSSWGGSRGDCGRGGCRWHCVSRSVNEESPVRCRLRSALASAGRPAEHEENVK